MRRRNLERTIKAMQIHMHIMRTVERPSIGKQSHNPKNVDILAGKKTTYGHSSSCA